MCHNINEQQAELSVEALVRLRDFVSPGAAVLLCLPDAPATVLAPAIEALGGRVINLGTDKSYGELSAAMDGNQPELYVGRPVALLSLLRVCGKGSLRRALLWQARPGTVINEAEDILGSPLWTFTGGRLVRMDGVDAAADELSALDDKLFAIGALVDYTLSRVPGGYKLDGLYSGWMDARQLGDVCDCIVAAKLRQVAMSDGPMYRAERTIE